MAIGIVDSPIKMVIFHRYVNVYQSAKKKRNSSDKKYIIPYVCS